tara:strand:+ start:3957 stop:4265 length:309 start_codon:yes stop_codon:yes gene_type:complete
MMSFCHSEVGTITNFAETQRTRNCDAKVGWQKPRSSFRGKGIGRTILEVRDQLFHFGDLPSLGLDDLVGKFADLVAADFGSFSGSRSSGAGPCLSCSYTRPG